MEADYSTTYRDGIIRESNPRWHDGEQRKLTTTPGRHVLDKSGLFPPIEDMTRTGSAALVLASGALIQGTAGRITFAAEHRVFVRVGDGTMRGRGK